MSFFLSWASLKLLTGSLLFPPVSPGVEFHWDFVLGWKDHPCYYCHCCEGHATHLWPRGQLTLQICVLVGFYGAIQQPQLCLSWSFHPSCAEIAPGSHLLCSTFCVPVLSISILCFQIPSHPLLAHKTHHMPLAGTVCAFCPLHSSWSCVY